MKNLEKSTKKANRKSKHYDKSAVGIFIMKLFFKNCFIYKETDGVTSTDSF
jgi:hypothetical protein